MLCCIQSSCNLKFGLILVSFITLANKIQGDPSGRLLHFVDFDLVVPMSALLSLGSCKYGTIGLACNVSNMTGGTPKIKINKVQGESSGCGPGLCRL